MAIFPLSMMVVSTVAASTIMVCMAAPRASGRAHLLRPSVLGPAEPPVGRLWPAGPLHQQAFSPPHWSILCTGRSSALVDPLHWSILCPASLPHRQTVGLPRQWSPLAWQWASLPDNGLPCPDSGLSYPGRSSFLSGHRAPAKPAPFPITASHHAATETSTSRPLR